MHMDTLKNLVNLVLPLVGMGLMVSYEICDTTCSSLTGAFMGLDLKYVGHLFMGVLLVLNFLRKPPLAEPANVLRTMMLAGALGGEVLLVRFQILHETFCPFCLAFGLCLLALFAVNARTMNRYLAWTSFLAGMAVFYFFFEGTVLSLYS
jgi:hypothetical protein